MLRAHLDCHGTASSASLNGLGLAHTTVSAYVKASVVTLVFHPSVMHLSMTIGAISSIHCLDVHRRIRDSQTTLLHLHSIHGVAMLTGHLCLKHVLLASIRPVISIVMHPVVTLVVDNLALVVLKSVEVVDRH